MGRYSRKDMLEFAKFAKSHQSSRNVEEAYGAYLKGIRLVCNREESIKMKIMKANRVFLNGKTIKDKYNIIETRIDSISLLSDRIVIESWNKKLKLLTLKTV